MIQTPPTALTGPAGLELGAAPGAWDTEQIPHTLAILWVAWTLVLQSL